MYTIYDPITWNLRYMIQDNDLIKTLCVAIGGEPSRHRLVYHTSDADDSVEEVVLHIQGILCTKNLPPVEGRIKSVRYQITPVRP